MYTWRSTYFLMHSLRCRKYYRKYLIRLLGYCLIIKHLPIYTKLTNAMRKTISFISVIAMVLLVAGLVMLVTGVVSPNWVDARDTHFGLFMLCVKGYGCNSFHGKYWLPQTKLSYEYIFCYQKIVFLRD